MKAVAEAERGRGLAQRLFESRKRRLPERGGILFIRADNSASLRAHERMSVVRRGSFRHNDRDFIVLSYEGQPGSMPNFAREAALGGLVCGIDEVGRGPLAGPVVACAVILDRGKMPKSLRKSIDDSKKLCAEEREEYALALRCCATIALGAAAVAEIDRINILRASLLAMRRAVAALPAQPTAALVDGNQAPALPCRVHTVVGGDGLSLSIAAASIIAKVARDRLMHRLALRYEGYGWETNVGYATAEHRAAIVRLGLTPHHRLSFQPAPDLFGFESRESP